MFRVGRTLVLAAGIAAFAFIAVAMMLVPTARAQTMGEYGATLGSSASSTGSIGSAIGPENSVGSSIGSGMGGGLNMGVATGNLQPEVVSGHGAPRTIIIGGGDTSHYIHAPSREDNADDEAGDDWVQVR